MHTLLGIANNIGFHVGDRLDIETVFCAAFVPPSTSVCPEIEKGRCCIGNARNCFLPTERGNSVPPSLPLPAALCCKFGFGLNFTHFPEHVSSSVTDCSSVQIARFSVSTAIVACIRKFRSNLKIVICLRTDPTFSK